MTIDLSSFEILSKNTYWDINSFVGNNDFESQTFESLFSKAVEKRCIADVQIGAFLSGGLDSTSVVKESKVLLKTLKLSLSVTLKKNMMNLDGLIKQLKN